MTSERKQKTLEQRVKRIEQLLGIGLPDYIPNSPEPTSEMMASFLAGDSKPLERWLAKRHLQVNALKRDG